MKTINIKQKLEEIGVPVKSLILGDYDVIGEYTAKRTRSPGDENYKAFGAYYRANYERGILIYNLIRQFNLTSFLEIGFGRGYSTFCAARAFHDAGVQGKIVTIDPNFDEKYLNALKQVFPSEWFSYVTFAKGFSQNILPTITEKFDLVYIDGDHSYAATKADWELSKNKANKFVLFDDYHLPEKEDPGIQCREAIDEIDFEKESFKEPELIKLDRRIFLDERGYTDDQILYGQVLFTKLGVDYVDW
jgi:predicted O-methyltransferase YrrM